MLNERVVSGAEAVEQRQENDMPLRGGLMPPAGETSFVDASAVRVWLVLDGGGLFSARSMKNDRVG